MNTHTIKSRFVSFLFAVGNRILAKPTLTNEIVYDVAHITKLSHAFSPFKARRGYVTVARSLSLVLRYTAQSRKFAAFDAPFPQMKTDCYAICSNLTARKTRQLTYTIIHIELKADP